MAAVVIAGLVGLPLATTPQTALGKHSYKIYSGSEHVPILIQACWSLTNSRSISIHVHWSSKWAKWDKAYEIYVRRGRTDSLPPTSNIGRGRRKRWSSLLEPSLRWISVGFFTWALQQSPDITVIPADKLVMLLRQKIYNASSLLLRCKNILLLRYVASKSRKSSAPNSTLSNRLL